MKKTIARIIYCGFLVFFILFVLGMVAAIVLALVVSVVSDPKGCMHAAIGYTIAVAVFFGLTVVLWWAERNK